MAFIRKIKKNGRIYLAEVENVRIDGKVVQRHVRYVGKEVDGKTRLSASISDVEFDHVRLSGPLMVLNHIAKKINLAKSLGEYGNELLSLAFAHCLDYKSVNQMARWFERTDLNVILNLKDLTEARLLKALDSLETLNPAVLQRQIFENTKQKYKLSNTGIVYDVTNTYLYGRKCPIGKYGKDKEGVKGRPLVQIGLAVTKDEAVPVFHKVFDGNVHDSRTFRDVLTDFQTYQLKDGIVVFDRGISSKKNQFDIRELQWKVLCGLPLNDELKKLLAATTSEQNIMDFKNRVRLAKTIFYVQTVPYRIGEVAGRLAFCFNEQKRNDLRESRYDEITHAQKQLSQGRTIKEDLEQFFGSDGRLLTQRIRDAEEFDGYSCLFTTASLSKEEMIRQYFDKDLIEKAFQSLKGVIKVQPVRHWLYNRVTAHVFICYLSYLLLSLLKIHLKSLDITPIQALEELDSVYRIYMRDPKKSFKLARLVTLTKKQEQILRAVDKSLMAECSV